MGFPNWWQRYKIHQKNVSGVFDLRGPQALCKSPSRAYRQANFFWVAGLLGCGLAGLIKPTIMQKRYPHRAKKKVRNQSFWRFWAISAIGAPKAHQNHACLALECFLAFGVVLCWPLLSRRCRCKIHTDIDAKKVIKT